MNKVTQPNILGGTGNNGAEGHNIYSGDFPFKTHNGVQLMRNAIV